MISIVSGRFRGRRLKVPKNGKVRPTANRVREALFNILQHRILFEELCVLDLFAGTGALGLEALSRGAQYVFFVECAKSSLSMLQQNINLCTTNLSENDSESQINVKVIHDRAEHWLPHFSKPQGPCLIFLDPPYLGGNYDPILSLLAQLPQIPDESWIAVESSSQSSLCFPSELELLQQRCYGTVKLELLQKRSSL